MCQPYFITLFIGNVGIHNNLYIIRTDTINVD
jgi:hypothetical protein